MLKNPTIESLVSLAETLSAIQIEGVDDEIGFSNSDKHVGAFLAAAIRADESDQDSIESLAALVQKYKRQATGLIGEVAFKDIKTIAGDRKINADDRARARNIVIATPSVHPTYGAQVGFSWQSFNELFGNAIRAAGGRPVKDTYGKWTWYIAAAKAPHAVSLLTESGAQIVGSIVTEGLAAAQPVIDNLVKATVESDHVALKFQYNESYKNAIKSLPFVYRKFDFETKRWFVPIKFIAPLIRAFQNTDADITQILDLQHTVALADQATPVEDIHVDEKLLERARPYQRTGIEVLTQSLESLRAARHGCHEVRGVILADDMGIGKSYQSIVASDAIAEEGETILIIVPANAKIKWATREIPLALSQKFEDLDICVIGKGKVKGVTLEPQPRKARWIIINYDLITPTMVDQLTAIGFAICIADEAHYCKNRDSRRSKLVMNGYYKVTQRVATHRDKRTEKKHWVKPLCEYATRRVFPLTGTPMSNRPKDIFPLLRAIGHKYGKNFNEFGSNFCDPTGTPRRKGGFGVEYNGATNLERLHHELAPYFLQRKKEDVLTELPPKTRDWNPVQVNLGEYQAAMGEFYSRMAERRKEAFATGRNFDAVRECQLADITAARVALSRAKVESTIETAEQALESGQKVIIFCEFTPAVEKFAEHFGEIAVSYTGATSQKKREENVQRFMTDPTCTVFIGNLIAAGTAIDLYAATYVIMHDLNWVPGNHTQAEDRACRLGQLKNVTVNYMIAKGSHDEDMANLLEEKFSNVNEFEGVSNKSLFNELVKRLAAAKSNNLDGRESIALAS